MGDRGRSEDRALGFGLTFPIPKRALRAHGLPPWGSSAPAHLTHPTAMQPAGGAHASSSSVVGLVPSVAELAVRSCCALVVGQGQGGGRSTCAGHRRGSRSPGSVSGSTCRCAAGGRRRGVTEIQYWQYNIHYGTGR